MQDITNPTPSASNDGPLTCNNVMTALPATGVTYAWSGGGTNQTKSVTVPGTYTVTVTNNSNGCSATASTVVLQDITNPTPSASNDGPLTCSKTTVVMTALPATGVTYAWSGGGTNQTKSVTVPGTYTVTVTNNSNGCSATASTVVMQDITNPTPSASNDGPLTCSKTTVVMTALPATGVTYAWSGGGTNQTKSVTVPGTYTVTVTNNSNGCSATASTIVLQDITNPTPSASNDGPLTCSKTTVVMTALPATGVTYAWSGGGTNQTKSVTVPGTYTVTVTNNSNGCSATASTVVLQDITPPVPNAGPDQSICINTSANLTATGGVLYNWSTNQTTAAITVTPLATTTYTVTVTGSNGCTASDQVQVIVKPLPVSAITGPATICALEPVLFTATGAGVGSIYQWTFSGGTPASATGSSATSQWSAIGEYAITLKVTLNECVSTYNTSIVITQNVFAVAGPDKEICQGGNVTINGSGPAGANYTWTVVSGDPTSIDNGGATSGILVSPLVTTTYRLTVTQNGCTRIDEVVVVVNVNNNPIANAGMDKTYCAKDDHIIGGNPTGTPPPATPNAQLGYIWSPPTGLNSTTVANPTLNISTPGNYSYQVIVFSLLTGCSDTDYVNFIIEPKGKIGDYVWTDLNANGCQEANEEGLNGVTVKLFSSAGVEVASTTTINNPTTGAKGYYQFEVCPGSYYVNFGKPTGYFFTGEKVCGDVDTDSDANTTSGNTQTVVLAPGQIISNLDAGLYQKATIGDFVFEDTNGNGVQDPGELGIPNILVTLTGTDGLGNPVILTTTSNGSGLYIFPNLVPGTYKLTFASPGANYTVSPQDQGGNDATDSDINATTLMTINTVLTSGETDLTWDAGFVAKAKLGDYVWEDLNANGVQDLGEPGIANLTVTLTGTTGGGVPVSASTTTNGSGLYLFDNLQPGTYKVTFSSPGATYFLTGQDLGGNDATDSDAAPGTLMTINTVLTSGESDLTWDAGFYKKASIGDFVWNDINANGIQDIGELGVPGVTVSITGILADGTLIPPSVQSTGPNGEYLFSNLTPGRYTVVVNKPSGYLYSPKDQGGNDTKDSDSDPLTGVMPEETLVSGEVNLTYDAGIYPEIKVELNKTFVSAAIQPNGTFNVTYTITVNNIGGPGKYDLKDTPGFDSDISINSASYTSNAPGNLAGALAGSGPWTLGNDISIVAFASHTYTLKVNVSLNLEDATGDNTYKKCGSTTQIPTNGEGLYNKASVDTNEDGIPEDEAFDCGDIPNVIMRKDFVGTVAKANGSFDVSYAIIVNNTGGATGTYSLKDTPLFDTDVVINSGTYGGQASGSMLTSGPTTLGTGVSIAAAATQTYNVTFNVTLKLDDAVGLTGDNVYTSCVVSGNGPGSGPGQGLYNKAELDKTGDGQTDITDDACGDLPNVIMRKDFVGTVAKANGSFDVSYAIIVNNTGGATGTYSLKDTPLFDTDVVINSGTYGGQASGSMLTSGPTTLGTGVSIAAAATQTYNVTFNVTLKLDDAVGLTGDNVYTSCAVSGNGPGSGPGQGLYNKAELDKTGDGQTDITDDACGDLPNVIMRKDFVGTVAKANGSFDVSYAIIVNNTGGATGTYSLKDTPLFDTDVVINSGTYGGQASGSSLQVVQQH
ncbi:MAG: carboxypeptidase regulatory-like domain-containing protein [Saprospiraceae bacterium]|nr:carboxypeptidase regulatory-like domain-containing protein [Saprospiraceae bacterium]